MGEDSEAKAASGELAVQADGRSVERKRDEHGRWLPGGPGGPGRKPRQTEQEYLIALEECVPIPEWRKIVTRAKTDAIDGDKYEAKHARDWLGKYVLPDPSIVFELRAGREGDGLLHYLELYHVGPGRQLPEDESE